LADIEMEAGIAGSFHGPREDCLVRLFIFVHIKITGLPKQIYQASSGVLNIESHQFNNNTFLDKEKAV